MLQFDKIDLQIPENEDKNVLFFKGYYNNKRYFDVANESKVKFNRVYTTSIGIRHYYLFVTKLDLELPVIEQTLLHYILLLI